MLPFFHIRQCTAPLTCPVTSKHSPLKTFGFDHVSVCRFNIHLYSLFVFSYYTTITRHWFISSVATYGKFEFFNTQTTCCCCLTEPSLGKMFNILFSCFTLQLCSCSRHSARFQTASTQVRRHWRRCLYWKKH